MNIVKKTVCFVLCAVAFFLIGVFSTQFKCVNKCPVLGKLMGDKCCAVDPCPDNKCCSVKKCDCASKGVPCKCCDGCPHAPGGCKDIVNDKKTEPVVCDCIYCACTQGHPCTCSKEKCEKNNCNCNKWKKK